MRLGARGRLQVMTREEVVRLHEEGRVKLLVTEKELKEVSEWFVFEGFVFLLFSLVYRFDG